MWDVVCCGCGMVLRAGVRWFGMYSGMCSPVRTCGVGVVLVVLLVFLVVLVLCRTDDWVMVMYVDVLDAVADDDDECGWIAACGRR